MTGIIFCKTHVIFGNTKSAIGLQRVQIQNADNTLCFKIYYLIALLTWILVKRSQHNKHTIWYPILYTSQYLFFFLSATLKSVKLVWTLDMGGKKTNHQTKYKQTNTYTIHISNFYGAYEQSASIMKGAGRGPTYK